MQNKSLRKYIGIFIVAICVIAVYKSWNMEFLGKFFSLLTPLYMGMIIAYILYFPSSKLERLIAKTRRSFIAKRARIIAILTVYILTGVIIYAAFRLLIPVLVSNLAALIRQIPSALDSFMTFLESREFMGYSIDRNLIMQEITGTVSVDTVLNYLNFENIITYVEGIISVSSTLVNTLVAIIISIYLILDREEFFTFGSRILGSIFRPKVKDSILKYIHKINEFVTRYFYCRVLDAVIMFFISYAAMLILRIPYALVLATIVGVFNIVPYIGSILSTTLVIVVTLFSDGLQRTLIIGVVMFILQQIDGNIIDPYLVKGRLKINPVWVIVAVIVGGGFGGVIGIMLGVPIVAVIKLIADDLMHKREVCMKYREKHGSLPSKIFGSDDK